MLRFVLVFALVGALGAGFVACSSGDDSSNPITPIDYDGAQPPRPGFEAGAACAQNNDCVTGLACLYPTTGCQAYKVCTQPITTCAQPQTVCSCLAETIQACAGFAADPVDYTGPCDDAGIVPSDDAGTDASVDQSAPLDAPVDTAIVDTGAADTSTE